MCIYKTSFCLLYNKLNIVIKVHYYGWWFIIYRLSVTKIFILLQCHLVRRIFGTYSDTCPEIVMVMNSVMIVKFMWEALGIDGNPTLEEVVEANQHLLVEGFDIPEGIPKD